MFASSFDLTEFFIGINSFMEICTNLDRISW